MTRIGVLGSGTVGQTLAKGLKAKGYEVRIGSRTPDKLAAFAKQEGVATGSFGDVGGWAEVLVLATKGTAAREALDLVGRAKLAGKVIMDVTNPIADEPPQDGVLKFFTGPNSSLMETLQAAYPDARFVKAFNSIGHAQMVSPKLQGGPPTMFYCGNDEGAKALVAKIISQFGWEGADMGTAAAARAIEPLCQLWCIPGFRQNSWTHAFKVLWK